MKHYELVLLLNASLQEKDRKDFVAGLEKDFHENIIQKDDIGLLKTAHDLGEKKGNDSFYFVSYYIKATEQDLNKIRESFKYNKMVYRYFLFGQNKTDEMFVYEKVQADMNKIIEERQEKKMGNKVTFFTHSENKKYVNWKAIPMIKKYVTRFGNIKPRKYTGNAVAVQKLLRTTIIKAREMGLLEYIK
ncbi:MAG: 30S ribosomal protein S18 [Candidatus Absconditabacteria bacterium]